MNELILISVDLKLFEFWTKSNRFFLLDFRLQPEVDTELTQQLNVIF